MNYLVGWDIETYMPSDGIVSRAKVLSNVNSIIKNLYLDKELFLLLDKVRCKEDLNIYERKIIHNLDRQIKIYKKLPKKFIIEFSDLITSGSTVWADAKEKNNLGIFLPVLKKIFEKTREKADYIGFVNEPYEAVFDEYEDGFSVVELDAFFNELKIFLSKIDIKKLRHDTKNQFAGISYDKKLLKELNQSILNFLGAEPKRFRLDTSSHPFSLFLSIDDIRMTTNYNKNNFSSSIFATVHEFGHGLFASGANKELEYTPLWPETSYTLHESQSRLWENMIAKNSNFIKVFIQKLKELSPSFRNFTVQDFIENFNKIEPSLIRTQADEITYHYHIIIRYEIERALLNKEIDVSEVNELWNSKYKQYLGIIPKTYSQGILQDIHWSFGNIGYFPTYSLGSVLSAIWLEKIEKDLKWELKETITIEDIAYLKVWLRDNIHQYSGTYTFKEIAKKVNGKEFSVEPWKKYIQKKYQINFDK